MCVVHPAVPVPCARNHSDISLELLLLQQEKIDDCINELLFVDALVFFTRLVGHK